MSLTRNLLSESLLERFGVAAVTTVLGIRLFLALTGYPRIGGAGLHIAHLLWGGLLMLVALVLLLAFLGHRVATGSAIVGGIGFGAFIDELGKFVTSDNDYFFRPAIALIYVVFVALFLTFRALDHQRPRSQTTYIANLVALVQEAVLHDLSRQDKAIAVDILRRCDPQHPVVHALTDLVETDTLLRASPPSVLTVLLDRLRHRYRLLVGSPTFGYVFVALFLLGTTVGLGLLLRAGLGSLLSTHRLSVSHWGTLAGSLASVIAVVLGVIELPRSRASALHWFKRSILVSLLVIDVFAFYQQELAALGYLGGDLVALVILESLLHHEVAVKRNPDHPLAPHEGLEPRPS